jgi:WD40 repeat protein/predicted Ser/Thr protein kinase
VASTPVSPGRRQPARREIRVSLEGMDDDSRQPRTAQALPRVREPVVARNETRFVIGGELGRGGMGRVVAAVDTMLDREVAIKQALDGDGDAARFEREARITAQLEHPSIVPIHDAGRDEHDRPFYIMRRIAGEPLADRIAAAPDAKARLALVPRFAIAVDAAAFAHARGIIHRDIKPWNILLGDYGETLLIDWGLARQLSEPDELAGLTSGTAGYMSPEQARGEGVDARADVYALGATLLDVLTGSLGRGLDGPTEWITRAAEDKLPQVEKLDPAIPAELVAIVGKALAPGPEDRYRDAGELAADLHAFLDGRLVAAHHYTALERAVRFVRRHRVAVAVAAAAVIAIVAIGVLAIRRVVDERDLARDARKDAESGQHLAADRAEVLLLDRASSLAERDPTRAAALLATLPSGSQHAARARDIAAIAALHGIEHGRPAHDGGIVALAIAPDGHHLLSAGGYDGAIKVLDLATGQITEVIRGKTVERAVWTDGGATITYATSDHQVQVVDVATHEVRALATQIAVDSLWAPGDGDRVRLLDSKRHVVEERATSGGDPRVLAENVELVAGEGVWFAVAGRGAVRIVDGKHERAIASYTAPPSGLAISDDGARVALAFRDSVSEWNAATGERRGTWSGASRMVLYAGGRLYAPNPQRNGQLDLLVPSGGHIALGADWSVLWVTRAGPRVALADAAGDIAFLDEYISRELRFDRPGARMIAGRPDSPYLAVGSNDGTLRWWDLRQMTPATYRIPGGTLCNVDAERIAVRGPGTLAFVPRSGGAPLTVESGGFRCLAGDSGGSIVTLNLGDSQTFDVVDAGGRVRHFTGQPMVAPRGIFFTRGRMFYEVTAREATLRWTAAAAITGAAATPRTFGFELADGRLVRVDATGAATTFQPPGVPALFQLGTDDSWWYAIGSRVYHDDRLAGELSSPVDMLWPTPSGTLAVLTADRVLWRATDRGFERVTAATNAQSVVLGMRMLGAVSYGAVRFVYIDTGERMSFPMRDATDVRLFGDDRVFAIVRGGVTTTVDVYTDPVPADPSRLASWLATATNAVAEAGNDAVTWR